MVWTAAGMIASAITWLMFFLMRPTPQQIESDSKEMAAKRAGESLAVCTEKWDGETCLSLFPVETDRAPSAVAYRNLRQRYGDYVSHKVRSASSSTQSAEPGMPPASQVSVVLDAKFAKRSGVVEIVMQRFGGMRWQAQSFRIDRRTIGSFDALY